LLGRDDHENDCNLPPPLDKPSAEITQLKSQCETLLERYEPVIEEWYNEKQDDGPLIEYLCRDRVLGKKDSGCLYEVLKPKGEKGKKSKKSKKSTDDDDEETRKEEL
jgi:protein canopy 3/4